MLDRSGFEKIRREKASVTVYMSVYNHEKYLRKAIDGVLMQETAYPYKLVIHDDKSTDHSADIIRDYAARFPDRIVPLLEEVNQHSTDPFGTTRHIRPYMRGKYLAFCEGDDYWIDPGKLEKQVSYLEAHPDASACYANILPIDDEGRHDESLRAGYALLPEGDYSKDDYDHFILKTQTATLVSLNYLRALTEEDLRFMSSCRANGDQKMKALLQNIGRVHYLPDVLAAHRRSFTNDSWTAYFARLSWDEKLRTQARSILALCRLEDGFFGSHPDITDYVCDWRVGYIRQCLKHHDLKKLLRMKSEPYLNAADVPFRAYAAKVRRYMQRRFGKETGKG